VLREPRLLKEMLTTPHCAQARPNLPNSKAVKLESNKYTVIVRKKTAAPIGSLPRLLHNHSIFTHKGDWGCGCGCRCCRGGQEKKGWACNLITNPRMIRSPAREKNFWKPVTSEPGLVDTQFGLANPNPAIQITDHPCLWILIPCPLRCPLTKVRQYKHEICSI